MIKPEITSILQNKITRIPLANSTNILVGPITLPVNLDGETVVFKWYNWLNTTDAELLQEDSSKATAAFNFTFAIHELSRRTTIQCVGIWRFRRV